MVFVAQYQHWWYFGKMTGFQYLSDCLENPCCLTGMTKVRHSIGSHWNRLLKLVHKKSTHHFSCRFRIRRKKNFFGLTTFYLKCKRTHFMKFLYLENFTRHLYDDMGNDLHHLINLMQTKQNKPEHDNCYNKAYLSSNGPCQLAHPRSLIRTFAGPTKRGSESANEKKRLCSASLSERVEQHISL